MSKSNPFDHTPAIPGVGPNTVDPATNATGPAPYGTPGEPGVPDDPAETDLGRSKPGVRKPRVEDAA